MRKLSKKQKNIIICYIKDNFFNNDALINKYNNFYILYKQLEKINDYETLYQDLERLKSDLIFKDTIQDKINYTLSYN